jgi:hypothetical protein
MLRKIVLRNTSLPIHDQVNQHHSRSIMFRNMIVRVWAPLVLSVRYLTLVYVVNNASLCNADAV